MQAKLSDVVESDFFCIDESQYLSNMQLRLTVPISVFGRHEFEVFILLGSCAT
jgi:hypothetical protein